MKNLDKLNNYMKGFSNENLLSEYSSTGLCNWDKNKSPKNRFWEIYLLIKLALNRPKLNA